MSSPKRSSVASGRGSDGRTAQFGFDANVPEGVDPEANWRFANSSKFRRVGSTSAERAGNVPGYVPGYGRSAAQNRPLGFTADWSGQFKPQIHIPKVGEDSLLPPAANSTPQPPNAPVASAAPSVTPTAPARPTVAPMATQPRITTQTGTQSSVRQVTGLPAGQRAMASFVPGQNSPANLAKRTRSPVDPLA